MISDEKRREAAAKLRALADANEGRLGTPRMALVLREGQEILGTVGLASVADVLRRHAELIDRPTCEAEQDYDYMEDGVPDCRVWVCHGCGDRFAVFRGANPCYCPSCGAYVRSGDE